MIVEYKQQLALGWESYPSLADPLRVGLIHRIGLGTRAADVVDAFTGGIPEAAKATGYRMPYHFVVEPDGTAVQCLPLGKQGPHAWKWNPKSLGIAALGDFTRHAPPSAQWRATSLLCCLLGSPQEWEFFGHDEVPEGSRDPNKKCPGSFWDMNKFRIDLNCLAVTNSNINDFWRYVAI